MKISLGGGSFSHDIFGTVPGDFNKAGFEQYLKMKCESSLSLSLFPHTITITIITDYLSITTLLLNSRAGAAQHR